MNNQEYTLTFDDMRRKDPNKELGTGVSSVVFEMVDERTKKSFAVKVCYKFIKTNKYFDTKINHNFRKFQKNFI
jgi:hypothetical protein